MSIISIIVPVYKVEAFLEECIDSVISQTFQDWELLLVDDGSPDKSGEICDNYAKKDGRIRVIHKPNGGVSSARNVGLDNALGEWVTFIDADDKILPGFLEGLYQPISNGEDVDFVHGGCCNMKNGEIISINQSYDYYVGCEPDIVFNNLRGLTISKLFNRDILRTWSDGLPLYFDEKMKIAEDMAFTLDYVLNVKRFAFVPEKGYCYRIDNMSSATKSSRKSDFTQEKAAFSHLWKSTMNYIERYSLTNTQARFRLHQRMEGFFNMIFSLYSSHMEKKVRLAEIESLCKEDVLVKLKDFSYENRNIRYLIEGNYKFFDSAMYLQYFFYSLKRSIRNIIFYKK